MLSFCHNLVPNWVQGLKTDAHDPHTDAIIYYHPFERSSEVYKLKK